MPPEAPLRHHIPFGLALNGADRQAGKVEVLNPPWNALNLVRRKDAEFYVAEGRAIWIGDAIRMTDFHPKNLAARARAAEGNGIVSMRPTGNSVASLGSFKPEPRSWKGIQVAGPAKVGLSGDGRRQDVANSFVITEIGSHTSGMIGAKAPVKVAKIKRAHGAPKRLRENAVLRTGSVAMPVTEQHNRAPVFGKPLSIATCGPKIHDDFKSRLKSAADAMWAAIDTSNGTVRSRPETLARP